MFRAPDYFKLKNVTEHIVIKFTVYHVTHKIVIEIENVEDVIYEDVIDEGENVSFTIIRVFPNNYLDLVSPDTLARINRIAPQIFDFLKIIPCHYNDFEEKVNWKEEGF